MTIVSTDIEQRLCEALVEALDTHPDIVALTGRLEENVIPWEDEGADEPPRRTPRIQYHVVDCTEEGGDGDGWSCTVQFGAFASTRDLANELVGVIGRVLTATLLGSLAVAPIDCYRTNRQRRDGGYDAERKHHRRDLDVTLIVQQVQ